MKVHTSYELLTDDEKPVPQGTRIFDIQNDDRVVTFAGMVIDEHGQLVIQLSDPDAPGDGVARLHAEYAERLRLATVPTSEPAPADDATTRQALNVMRDLFFDTCNSEGLPTDLASFVQQAVVMNSLPILLAARAAVTTYRNSLNIDDIPF